MKGCWKGLSKLSVAPPSPIVTPAVLEPLTASPSHPFAGLTPLHPAGRTAVENTHSAAQLCLARAWLLRAAHFGLSRRSTPLNSRVGRGHPFPPLHESWLPQVAGPTSCPLEWVR